MPTPTQSPQRSWEKRDTTDGLHGTHTCREGDKGEKQLKNFHEYKPPFAFSGKAVTRTYFWMRVDVSLQDQGSQGHAGESCEVHGADRMPIYTPSSVPCPQGILCYNLYFSDKRKGIMFQYAFILWLVQGNLLSQAKWSFMFPHVRGTIQVFLYHCLLEFSLSKVFTHYGS